MGSGIDGSANMPCIGEQAGEWMASAWRSIARGSVNADLRGVALTRRDTVSSGFDPLKCQSVHDCRVCCGVASFFTKLRRPRTLAAVRAGIANVRTTASVIAATTTIAPGIARIKGSARSSICSTSTERASVSVFYRARLYRRSRRAACLYSRARRRASVQATIRRRGKTGTASDTPATTRASTRAIGVPGCSN